ncbi:MAG: hypothetical protein RLZZ28_2087 [Bacteroidota bacterium]
MHSLFTLRRILFSGFVLIIFSAGCTRISSTEIGAGLLASVDGVNTLDTVLEVITDNFDDPDSARVYKSDLHSLGVITNDPLFGKTTASMYFEMKPITYPFFIQGNKDSMVIDSAVLILSYRGFYGDSTIPLTLRVNEIDKTTPLDIYTNYPSNYPAAFPIKTAGSMGPAKSIDIRRLGDSVNNRYENAKNQIRIRLDNSVAKRFLKDYDSTNAYASDSAFRSYFAGFALNIDQAGGANALLKVSLVDSNTKFALYYSSSSTGATVRDTAVTYLVFGSSTSGDANQIIRNRAGSEISKHLTTTSKPDSLVYVQASPGNYVRIRIPGLQNLSNRIIHRAELITEQVPDDANLGTIEQQMLPPRYLLLSRFDSALNAKRNIPNDYILISGQGPNVASFGGYIAYKAINGYDKVTSYTFDLTRYTQGIVTRKDSAFALRLTAPANDSIYYTQPYPLNLTPQVQYLGTSIGNDAANGRVRLGGGTHSRFRMRLRVIFSRI